MPRSIRNAIVALSIANICFLSSWLVLLNPNHYSYYNWPADPGFVEIEALILAIFVLGFFFWVVATAANRLSPSPPISRFVLLVVLILPINSFISDYLHISIRGLLPTRHWWSLLVVLASFLGFATLFRYNRQVTRVVLTLLLTFSPLILINLTSALWLREKFSSPPLSFHDSRPTTTTPSCPQGPHIIWIIFDEFDQNTAFVNRLPGTELPELDRFRNQALRATNAYPPNMFTLVSMPSLITGQLVADSTPVAPNECKLSLATGGTVDWSSQSNVFSEARSEGFSTGLVGWYHPYCRVIGADLDSCSWVPVVDQINPSLNKLSLVKAIWLSVRTAAFRIPFVFRMVETQYERQRQLDHHEEYDEVLKAATTLLQQDINLRLLHFPIPHHPWIYDLHKKDLSTTAANGYVDNLALVDRTLGEVRTALESTSSWDSSIVLISSDHWWRQAATVNGKRDHRIPFMLKLAGQQGAVEFRRPFNTVLTRELLMQLLRGNLTRPAEVASWIENNSKFDESPLTLNEP